MSDEFAVSVHALSKCYQIYGRPRDRLMQSLWRGRKTYYREFWALRDVSFAIERGETVGIVGGNGSGKSTLLQLICGTLTPTTGNIEVRGRIAALLELGAGFNPEFTGRENVQVSAAISGLTPREISARFDAIAAFADIGDFIDQPVKTYSSGMYVRLAFSVAINLEPDILVVDEALSVGDEAFQRKCFAHIRDIQRRGGTILFVSHSSTLVVELCDRALLINHGELLLAGPPKRVVSQYHKLAHAPADQAGLLREEIRRLYQLGMCPEDKDEPGAAVPSIKPEAPRLSPFYEPGLVSKSVVEYPSRGASIENPGFVTLDGEPVNNLVGLEEYVFTYSVSFTAPARGVRFGMLIKTVSGLELGGATTATPADAIATVAEGSKMRIRFRFRCLLAPGVYFLNAGVFANIDGDEVYLDRRVDVAMFRVQPSENPLATGLVDFYVLPSVSPEPG